MSPQVAPPAEKFTPSIFYFPCLHQELAAGPLPEEVHFLNPGLSLPSVKAKDARVWTPNGLPYAPSSALRCVQDLLAEGETLGHDLLLSVGAGGGRNVLAASAVSPLGASEAQALRAFTHTGDFVPAEPDGKDDKRAKADAREQAQKILLLYAHLEEVILVTRQIAQKIGDGEAALHDLLQADDQDDAVERTPSSVEIPLTGEDLLGQSLARWPEILRAWLEFLPPTVIFYTADLNVLAGLETDAAHPLPPEEAARYFPVSVPQGWTFTALTLPAFGREVRLVSGQGPAGV